MGCELAFNRMKIEVIWLHGTKLLGSNFSFWVAALRLKLDVLGGVSYFDENYKIVPRDKGT